MGDIWNRNSIDNLHLKGLRSLVKATKCKFYFARTIWVKEKKRFRFNSEDMIQRRTTRDTKNWVNSVDLLVRSA